MTEQKNREGISVKKSADFSAWYTEVLTKSEFIDYSEVSGMLVFRPAAYFAWQTITGVVDKELRSGGVEDVYFPLLIPEHLLRKEAEHFAGFTAEVAWVTEGGKSKLDEKLAIRPTSETIMYSSFAKWIRSWRDLPMRYNQWNNVVRWEFKHPTPFIRSREFLWNEGHSVFASGEEAEKERDFVLGVYQKVLKEYFALPGIPGVKSESEKFAGAMHSYSIEHIMPDGYAIQGPDFHLDGQNFSKAFEIKFLDKNGNYQYAWQNTYAITTRELGVMIATHGDDKGLVMPPKLAYVQIVIVPIFKKGSEQEVLAYARSVANEMGKNYRTLLDDDSSYSPGYKFNKYELMGVPIRIEIGEKELSKDVLSCTRRDTGEKSVIARKNWKESIEKLLNEINANLYAKAEKFMLSSIHIAYDYETLKSTIKNKKGIVKAPWCGEAKCELKIKEETGAKITNIPFDQAGLKPNSKCVYCGGSAKFMANFARSY
ncbi:MAG: proline--tRNA ligase [Candidatus Micrarchaeaceae archaeon]